MECHSCLWAVQRLSLYEAYFAELGLTPPADGWTRTRRITRGLSLMPIYDTNSMTDFPVLPNSSPQGQTPSLSSSSPIRPASTMTAPPTSSPIPPAPSHPSPAPSPPAPSPPPCMTIPPGLADDHTTTTLVLGSSIVRHVSLELANSKTICVPGARVQRLSRMVPAVLHRHPSLRRIVFHVGSNDVMERDFDSLKAKYRSLFSSVPHHVQITVSGPLPVHGLWPSQREKRFRLSRVHHWLRGYCNWWGLDFVDNFDCFAPKHYLFKWDGLHLRPRGARLLSRNIEMSLGQTQHPPLPSPPCSLPSNAPSPLPSPLPSSALPARCPGERPHSTTSPPAPPSSPAPPPSGQGIA